MSKKVSLIEEVVEILEAGGMTISRSGDLGYVKNAGGLLSVQRPGNAYPLWINDADDMRTLLSDGPVAVFSRSEVDAIYKKA